MRLLRRALTDLLIRSVVATIVGWGAAYYLMGDASLFPGRGDVLQRSISTLNLVGEAFRR